MKEFLSCIICYEDFDPKDPELVPGVLKCGHSQFCKRCLKAMGEKNKKRITCPICRKEQAYSNFEVEVPTPFVIV